MDVSGTARRKSVAVTSEGIAPETRRSRVRPSRARGLRTSTGCLTCRKRRVKCDERKPKCVQCSKSDRTCQYGQAADQRYTTAAGAGSESPRPHLEPGDEMVEDARYGGSGVDNPGVAQGSSARSLADQQPSADTAPYLQAISSAPAEASIPLKRPGLVRTPQNDPPDTGNDQNLDSIDLGFSASPLARSQISLLSFSPFEWYDLLARDATSNIQRLNGASTGELQCNLPEITLSRRQSLAPERPEVHLDQAEKHSNQPQPVLEYGDDGIEASLSDRHLASEPWNTACRIELSAVDLNFLRYYTEVVGPILDLFDPARHFTNVVPHLAIRNTGLLKSILAVAAKHMSLGVLYARGDHADQCASSPASLAAATGPPSEPDHAPAHMATQYYYETLHYLSQTLLYPSYADSPEILATAIMISTYEMFDADGASTSGGWERHLRGAFWIQRSQDNDGESANGLRRAVWWAWLRQDIWAAFRAGRPTLTIWRARKNLEELDSDELATRIIYICAKCVEFAAADKMSPDQDFRHRIEQGNRLLRALDDWHRVLPASFQPVTVAVDPESSRALSTIPIPSTTPDSSGWNAGREPQASGPKSAIKSVWIHPPSHAGSMQMYHFARAIVLLNQPTTGGLNSYRLRDKHLNESVQMVCGIAKACQEHESAMAFVNVQALFAVGQCIQSPEMQAELLRILENMLRISRYPARGLVAELKKVWQE